MIAPGHGDISIHSEFLHVMYSLMNVSTQNGMMVVVYRVTHALGHAPICVNLC